MERILKDIFLILAILLTVAWLMCVTSCAKLDDPVQQEPVSVGLSTTCISQSQAE